MSTAAPCSWLMALIAPGLLACATASTAGPAASAPPPDGPHADAVRTIVAPLLADRWLDGVAVALITPAGREVYTFAAPTSAPIARDTLFEIGSITKVYNALTLATAVVAGELALDRPVSELLPAAAALAAPPGPVTLAHLATHTSGLPRLPASFAPRDTADPYADFDDAALAAALATPAFDAPPGARYGYSNLGAGLLGRALAARFALAWEDLVRARVLVPLGLADTRATLDGAAAARLAPGHSADGLPVPPWRFDALAAAGALRATVDDVARFVEANLRPDTTALAAALRLTHVARHDIEGGGRIALGWHLSDSGTLWHNGGTGGFHSYAALRVDDGIGVVVLANTAAPLVDTLGVTLLGLLRGRPAGPLELPPLARVGAAALERCAGVYALDGTTTVTITRDGDLLVAAFSGQAPLRLFPEDAQRARFRAFDGQVIFEADPAGGPAAAARVIAGGEDVRAPRVTAP